MAASGVTINLTGLNPEAVATRILSTPVKLAISQDAARLMTEYVPMDSGTLSQTIDIQPDYVHYMVPYAKANYYGKNRNFSQDRHPLATGEWDKAMITGKGGQFFREVEAIIRRGE